MKESIHGTRMTKYNSIWLIIAFSLCLLVQHTINKDFNECDNNTNLCQPLHCINTLGSYECGCKENFEEKDGKCVEDKGGVSSMGAIILAVFIISLVVAVFIGLFMYKRQITSQDYVIYPPLKNRPKSEDLMSAPRSVCDEDKLSGEMGSEPKQKDPDNRDIDYTYGSNVDTGEAIPNAQVI